MSKEGRADKGDASTSIISRHGEFYLTDEMIVLQVENRLFRVHRHFLAKYSPIFGSMFSLPRIPGEGATVVEGASDENPIYLSGVTELEFETLLRYFYSLHGGLWLPEASWIALLSIAHRYDIQNARARAIREVYSLLKQWDMMQRGPDSDLDMDLTTTSKIPEPDHLMLISIAEKYDVPLQQVHPSFVRLVMREEPLAEAEIARLSTLTLHRLARGREDYLRRTTRAVNLNSRNVAKDIVRDIWPVAEK